MLLRLFRLCLTLLHSVDLPASEEMVEIVEMGSFEANFEQIVRPLGGNANCLGLWLQRTAKRNSYVKSRTNVKLCPDLYNFTSTSSHIFLQDHKKWPSQHRPLRSPNSTDITQRLTSITTLLNLSFVIELQLQNEWDCEKFFDNKQVHQTN